MPGFALLVYSNAAAGVNDSNVAMTAATDPDFQQDGSGNYRFTEDYNLLGACLVGASNTKGRFQAPHWQAFGEFDIFAVNRGVEAGANPWVDWYKPRGIPIPKNESLQVQESNNLGASTEQEECLLWIGAADGLWPLPPAGVPFKTIATIASFTPTINIWNTGRVLTFVSALRTGVYAVIGAVLQMDDVAAFRLNFDRYRMYNGKKLRPGGIAQNAVGNQLNIHTQKEPGLLGEWGRFWTVTAPTVDVFATAADAGGGTLFLDLVYLGDDPALAYQGSGGGPAMAS